MGPQMVRDTVTRMGPRGQGPSKNRIVIAPAKIIGLIMFHLGCQIKFLVFLRIFGIKKSKKTMRVFIDDSFPMPHGHFYVDFCDVI